jgi:hypothetical protein
LLLQRVLAQVRGRPPRHQFGKRLELGFGVRQVALRMAGIQSKPMIDRAVKRRRIAQEDSVLALQMAHLFEDVDALRRIQHAEKDAAALQPQVHQNEVDVVISARPGL